MSVHPAAAPQASPQSAGSPKTSTKLGTPGTETAPTTPTPEPATPSSLEPHWEPVVSAATD